MTGGLGQRARSLVGFLVVEVCAVWVAHKGTESRTTYGRLFDTMNASWRVQRCRRRKELQRTSAVHESSSLDELGAGQQIICIAMGWLGATVAKPDWTSSACLVMASARAPSDGKSIVIVGPSWRSSSARGAAPPAVTSDGADCAGAISTPRWTKTTRDDGGAS
jgi:hypothetical protein